MKKTLAWLLTLFMVLTISSVTVFAAGTDVAKIGDVGYSSFEEALNAVQDGETITLVAGATGDEHSTEIKFEKKIEFTVTGKAPDYAIPVITFENATVNIEDAEFMTAELDARQNATINVVNSNINDVGGNSIVKSYYNGAINIKGTSEVYTMQVTTMGYITVSDTAKLNATWQTNVYGNGLITVEDKAVLATGALNLTGKDYEGRDNKDTDRVGKPATVVVDGATLKVGEVYSSSGADYSYNADGYGINVGTISGKAALFDIKNGANVSLRMQNNGTVNFGAGATVNVADSALKVICRGEGEVALNNNGTVNVSGESTLNVATLTGNTIDFLDGAIIKDSTIGGDVMLYGKVTFKGDNTFAMLYDYGAAYSADSAEWIVEKDASVTLTNTDRYGFGYGDKVTIYGNLTDALSARKNLSDTDADVNMYGGLVGMTNSSYANTSMVFKVEDAYVIFGVEGDKSFGNKPGYYGSYQFDFDNSVITANGFKFYEDNGKAVFTFDKSDLLVNGVFMTNDADSKFTFTDSVIVSKATSNGSDDKNQNAGELILNNSSLTYNAPFTNVGTLTLDATSSLTAPEIIGTGKIVIDTTGLTDEDRPVVGNLSGFKGTIEVVGNTDVRASIDEDGNLVLTTPVASIGDVKYYSLQAALAAATNGDTVILLNNISDAVDYNVDKTLTLDLNGYTIESDATATLTATAGKLTIVDSSADQTGAIIGAKAIHSSAYVAIQSGKFVGTITTDNGQADDSQVCITGGNFSVKPNAKLVKHTYIVVPAEDETYNVIPDEYEVIIIANGGEVTGAGFYKFGETVYLNAGNYPGYQFAGWMSDDVELTDRGNTLISFAMPDHAVTVTAYWATSGVSTPVAPVVTGTLHFETNGGTAIDSLTGVSGRKVDLAQYVPALEGYTFAGWYSDAALTKPVTEITLRGTKTVYAGWIKNVTPEVPVVTMPFTDVAADAYYYNAVLWAVNTGITNGITDTTFAPDMVCTRAQVVTFLWRAAGCPVATNNDMPFADVSRDMYYYDAVLWAVEMGITNGISDTEFAPDAECSRAQIVTFLWRALGAPDAAADAGFVDVDADAYYATAVEWAVDNGITNGMGDNTFGADADCTRGQTVTFLFRFFCK